MFPKKVFTIVFS